MTQTHFRTTLKSDCRGMKDSRVPHIMAFQEQRVSPEDSQLLVSLGSLQ